MGKKQSLEEITFKCTIVGQEEPAQEKRSQKLVLRIEEDTQQNLWNRGKIYLGEHAIRYEGQSFVEYLQDYLGLSQVLGAEVELTFRYKK